MNQVVSERPARQSVLTLHLRPAVELTDEQFFALCQLNRDLRLERTAQGNIIIMPPTGWETGVRNARINKQLSSWADRDKSGLATDSSTGFKLPNGADRSPDAAWVSSARLVELTPEQKRGFLPLCPDFVIELRSPSDNFADLQAKMEEYLENGARLGWLIDPETKQVYVYRPGTVVEVLKDVKQVSGEPELQGFVLDLGEIWELGEP
jgi:Uma2 family endonuclease